VHWIDHWVVCTNDVERWWKFHTQVLNAQLWDDPNGILRGIGVFINFGRTRTGGFDNRRPMPPTLGLGKGLPRYGHYIRESEIDAHLQRLEAAGAAHSEPIRRTDDGEAGISIFWQDPDGNQFEFWAPEVMPEGAMAGCGPNAVGRISHGVFESRDLDRTAEFFARYCSVRPEPIGDPNVLVLRLLGGARLVYHKVETLGGRTSGCGLRDTHTALAVHANDYLPNYERMWAELPDWEGYDPAVRPPIADPGALPARTAMHGTRAGRKLHALTGRGDDFLDWDTNLFHFYGGQPVGESMAVYDGYSLEHYIGDIERKVQANAFV
jgi:predicted enzyme related to lactoylglutathione lyase